MDRHSTTNIYANRQGRAIAALLLAFLAGGLIAGCASPTMHAATSPTAQDPGAVGDGEPRAEIASAELEPVRVAEAYDQLNAIPWSLRPIATQAPGFPEVSQLATSDTLPDDGGWSAELPIQQ